MISSTWLYGTDNHPSIVDKIEKQAKRISQDTARTGLKTDGNPIGYLTVVTGKGVNLWNGLRSEINTHEFDLENLGHIDEPPYEAIYTRSSNGQRLVFYHFAEKGSKLAKAVLSSNR